MTTKESRKPRLVSVPGPMYEALETTAELAAISVGEMARAVLRCWMAGKPPPACVLPPPREAPVRQPFVKKTEPAPPPAPVQLRTYPPVTRAAPPAPIVETPASPPPAVEAVGDKPDLTFDEVPTDDVVEQALRLLAEVKP